jgi:hypothetical protein
VAGGLAVAGVEVAVCGVPEALSANAASGEVTTSIIVDIDTHNNAWMDLVNIFIGHLLPLFLFE